MKLSEIKAGGNSFQMVALFRESADGSTSQEQLEEIQEIIEEHGAKILKKKVDEDSIALLIQVPKNKIDDLYDELDKRSDSIGVYTNEHGDIPATAMTSLSEAIKYKQFKPGQKVRDREGKEHIVARQDDVKVFMKGHSYGHFHPNNLTLVESTQKTIHLPNFAHDFQCVNASANPAKSVLDFINAEDAEKLGKKFGAQCAVCRRKLISGLQTDSIEFESDLPSQASRKQEAIHVLKFLMARAKRGIKNLTALDDEAKGGGVELRGVAERLSTRKAQLAQMESDLASI